MSRRSGSEHGVAKRPRLMFVAHTLNPGGTERLVIDMALDLNADCDITVVCLDEPGAWVDQLRSRGVAVHCVWRQPGFDLNVVLRIAQLARSLQIDLIHAHQYTPWFYSALSRVFCFRPRLLFQEHGRFYPEIRNRRRALFNRTILVPLTHRFIAVSRDVKNRLAQFEWLPAGRVDVIYNGCQPVQPLDLQERNNRRQSLGYTERDFVVGTVGRLDPIKNIPLLVHALKRAQRVSTALRALIVGDGPEMSSIRRLVACEGLDDAVRLAGHRDDARELVQCIDLFVLPSRSEGTSVALLEAMSVGVPAVVTAVGGNPEVVQAGVSGWVVTSGDVVMLSNALLEAESNDSRRREVAEQAIERFRTTFSFDRMMKRYRNVYCALVDVDPAEGWARCETP